MRRPFIAGNWKMNKTVKEAIALAKTISQHIDFNNKEVMIAPPYTALVPVFEVIKDTALKLGAQDIYFRDFGAFTGAISGAMLYSLGCRYVIIGHSERRSHFKETDREICAKIKAALRWWLKPLVCIGEDEKERERGETFLKIENQLKCALEGLKPEQISRIVIAYEPIWAIGTGKSATPSQAQEVHIFIRRWLKEKFGGETAMSQRILYGGSVTPENIKDLMNQEDIDGVLVGGASLDSMSFVKIANYNI